MATKSVVVVLAGDMLVQIVNFRGRFLNGLNGDGGGGSGQ